MSAIVEGVSMVRHCGECELNKLNWGRCHQILRGCPIIGEIPDKHGRLIDADKLMQWIEHVYGDKDIIKFITDDIKRQPTIVEAEVSE